MSDFTTALDAALPPRTAGQLPAARTFGMVTDALESKDVQQLSDELNHTRAHYQSLEYMLNNEGDIIATILSSFEEAPELPTPTTVEEAVRYVVRVYSTELLNAAYDTAHGIGLPMALMGLNVKEALELLYSDLDHQDPDREVTDADIAALLGRAPLEPGEE
jgi:hypothetical protein